MVELAGAIGTLIVRDAGPEEMLRRLSDPFWFQAFGCVLGFDWHSSGVTTTVCGALKEAARKYGGDLGIVVCGGKGATSRKTPDDIRRACDKSGDDASLLVRASKLAAKVDNAAVQDGFQLYHHAFFFVPGETSPVVNSLPRVDSDVTGREAAAKDGRLAGASRLLSPAAENEQGPAWCVVQQGMNPAS